MDVPSPLPPNRRVDLTERLEPALLLRSRHAAAGKFDGIVEEVADNLVEAERVSEDPAGLASTQRQPAVGADSVPMT